MKKLFKNKKVVFAIVTLVVTLVAVGLGVEFNDNVANSVTEVICQVITCQ